MNPILRHFGLRAQPFALTPDPQFYFPWDHAQAILAGAEFALLRGDGLLHIGGMAGSGKTLLCHLLLTRLDRLGVNTAYLNAPVADPLHLPAIVTREFGAEPGGGAETYRGLGEFLLREFAAGRRNVLVIDEAQALGARGLELIRLLSNLETGAHKLLQIVMFGQPELDRLLARPALRQIAQRIAFGFTTQPLPAALAGDYVRHRIGLCASDEAAPDLFDPAATALLADSSRGWPRLINILADKAMIAAYAAGEDRIRRAHIRAAITDTPHLDWPVSLFGRIIARRAAA